MVGILEKLLGGLKTRKEEAELIHKVDILKWENELKPDAKKLAEELNLPYEEALTYLKSIDNKKGSGDFKEKLQNLMEGMKAASETINAAMGVDSVDSLETQVPTKESVQKEPTRKKKRSNRSQREKEDDVFDLNVEEPDIYIPEIYIPKLPKM